MLRRSFASVAIFVLMLLVACTRGHGPSPRSPSSARLPFVADREAFAVTRPDDSTLGWCR